MMFPSNVSPESLLLYCHRCCWYLPPTFADAYAHELAHGYLDSPLSWDPESVPMSETMCFTWDRGLSLLWTPPPALEDVDLPTWQCIQETQWTLYQTQSVFSTIRFLHSLRQRQSSPLLPFVFVVPPTLATLSQQQHEQKQKQSDIQSYITSQYLRTTQLPTHYLPPLLQHAYHHACSVRTVQKNSNM